MKYIHKSYDFLFNKIRNIYLLCMYFINKKNKIFQLQIPPINNNNNNNNNRKRIRYIYIVTE